MSPPQAKVAALLSSPDDIEAQFYEALQSGDIAKLMAVWSDDDDVVCVHPGGPRVLGHAAVRATFEELLSRGAVPVIPERVRRLQTAGSAVHNVVERIDAITPEGVRTAWVVATNVYVKTTQGWRMVAHHASAAEPMDVSDTGEAPAILH
jgi:ketosteroid isomerase-like protein